MSTEAVPQEIKLAMIDGADRALLLAHELSGGDVALAAGMLLLAAALMAPDREAYIRLAAATFTVTETDPLVAPLRQFQKKN
jgi:hypothetical protein